MEKLLNPVLPGSGKAPARILPKAFLWRSPGKHPTRKILHPTADGDSVDIVLYAQGQIKSTETPLVAHNPNLTHIYLKDLKMLNI